MAELIAVLEETNRLLSNHFNSNTLEIIAIFISGAALFFAIWTAHRQNTIALFEKRFAAYSDLLKVKSFADMMQKDECSFRPKDLAATGKDPEIETHRRCSEILLNFQAIFFDGTEKPDAANVVRVTIFTIRSTELSLHTLPMLYSKKLPNKGIDVNKEITTIFEYLALFMIDVTSPAPPFNDQLRTDFVSATEVFFQKYADIFEEGLRL